MGKYMQYKLSQKRSSQQRDSYRLFTGVQINVEE